MMDLEPLGQFAIVGIASTIGMALLWLVRRHNANIVDVGWTAGMAVAAIFLAATSNEGPRRWLTGALAAVWALRLAVYLFINRVIGKEEDGRYAALRKRWGDRASFGFLFVFLAQAVLIVLFAIPFRIAMGADRPLFDVWDIAAVTIWVASVAGESLADGQLAAFRANPMNRGQVCQVGLWRYSRHPNYFFEWLHWWTYPLLAVGQPWMLLTLIGPALMGFFLFRVTGIPATEAHAIASRGDAYRRYQQTTSAFFPWFPKK